MVQIRGGVPLAVVVALLGCIRSGDCEADLLIRLSEAARTLAVGERFVPAVELRGCNGRQRLTDVLTWKGGDPAVISVDSAHGVITGLAPGQTIVRAHGARYGDLGEIVVTVVAPLPNER